MNDKKIEMRQFSAEVNEDGIVVITQDVCGDECGVQEIDLHIEQIEYLLIHAKEAYAKVKKIKEARAEQAIADYHGRK